MHACTQLQSNLLVVVQRVVGIYLKCGYLCNIHAIAHTLNNKISMDGIKPCSFQ